METSNLPPRASSLASGDTSSQGRASPYIFQTLVEDLPLDNGEQTDIRINVVETWEDNLYVGTSAAEVLHFVKLPGEDGDSVGPRLLH